MKLNREFYLDKVRACWIGKNIGGTMGTPYEAKREMQDISGFNSEKGQPLGNDDLDLQLVWLIAVEDRGIRNITPQLLGEYWMNYIPPHWNEYGICKANMRVGLRAPYCGEYNNDLWKNSNGAWIRTEIWACLFPGIPDLAAKYAYRDACVDHGMGEGTYAAMFVAAMESAAFFEKDVRKLIEIGLSYIPENCLFADTIKLAVKLYDDKTPFKDARCALIESTADLGWFQAPANVGFVILGLLYGEGDYKKSMIYAINCGDDTDCTGATIGSLMGIMGGCSVIPKDWEEYIGDNIVSVALDLSYTRRAKTCTELTRRVYELLPSVMKAYGTYMEYTDGENELEELGIRVKDDLYPGDFDIPATGLSLDLPDMIIVKGRVEFDKEAIAAGEEIKFKFVFKNCTLDPKQVLVKLYVPEGWSCNKRQISINMKQYVDEECAEGEIIVTAGENVDAVNELAADVRVMARPTHIIAPFVIMGK